MSKKQEIISIAGEFIHSKGYQATSIDDILPAANIEKGQFYHYFSSKYGPGLAVVENLVQEWDRQ
jgi:TetR/AcrR family transcriptional repressor of nem operon